MWTSDSRDIIFGQLVHRRSDPGTIGRIVGVITTTPCEALVRWPDSQSTFEALGDLVAAGVQPLEGAVAPLMTAAR
jgi:hypothetical protein